MRRSRVLAASPFASLVAFVLASLLAGLDAAPVAAQELRADVRLDAALTALGGASWIGSELLKPSLAPARCRWCDRDAEGKDTLNGLDRSVRSALLWESRDAADTTSSVLAFGLAPALVAGADVLAAGHDGRRRDAALDVLLVAEATVIAVDVNQLFKFLFGRERPFVHALAPEEKARTAHPSDNDLSFFSGHSTATFALATSAGTIASMRHYRWATAVWLTGELAAAATAYLRIAADKHYFTDVLVGVVVGSAIGFAVPYLAHRPGDAAAAASTGTSSSAMSAPSFGWSGQF